MQGDLRAAILGVVGAAVLAPLLAWILSRLFPPSAGRRNGLTPSRARLRNQFIEYAGVAFFIAGMAVPFFIQGTDRLKPTVTNVAMIFSFGLLALVGGVVIVAALFGDRNADSFVAYFEQERRISRKGVRLIASVMVAGSILALLGVLIFG